MTTIAYIGTDERYCTWNSPLVRCIEARDWRLLRLKSPPLSGRMPDAFLVETPFIEPFLKIPKAAGRPWVWIASHPTDALRAWTFGAAHFLLPDKQDAAAWEQALDKVACHLHYLDSSGKDRTAGGQSLDITLIKGRRVRIAFKDILFLEAHAEITNLYTRLPNHEKVVATRNLGFWETRLPQEVFFRVHKKFLVNLDHIKRVEKDMLFLAGHAVPVAKRRIKDTENALLARGLELE